MCSCDTLACCWDDKQPTNKNNNSAFSSIFREGRRSFFCVQCAKSSGRWLLGSPQSAVVRQLALKACPLLPRAYITAGFFFFSCVRCDDCAKSSGWWLLRRSPSAVVRQLAPRAWCPRQCLLAKTVGVLSPGVGRSEECAQEFSPQSHIHSGLNRQDPIFAGVFLAYSYQFADGRWWFGSSCQRWVGGPVLGRRVV